MSLANWIASQTTTVRLCIGLAVGTLVYALFRTFIYFANKGSEAIRANAKKSTWQENLKSLASEN